MDVGRTAGAAGGTTRTDQPDVAVAAAPTENVKETDDGNIPTETTPANEGAKRTEAAPETQTPGDESKAAEAPAPAQAKVESVTGLPQEAFAAMEDARKAEKTAARAQKQYDKLNNSLPVDDPKVEKARVKRNTTRAAADAANDLANSYFKPKEPTNAVQEQSPAEVDVRQRAEDGKTVGKGDKVDQVPAGEETFLPSELEEVENVEVTLKKKKRGAAHPMFPTAKEALEFVDKKIAAYNALIADLRKC